MRKGYGHLCSVNGTPMLSVSFAFMEKSTIPVRLEPRVYLGKWDKMRFRKKAGA